MLFSSVVRAFTFSTLICCQLIRSVFADCVRRLGCDVTHQTKYEKASTCTSPSHKRRFVYYYFFIRFQMSKMKSDEIRCMRRRIISLLAIITINMADRTYRESEMPKNVVGYIQLGIIIVLFVCVRSVNINKM